MTQPCHGRISVVVPTRNSERTLEACLESVRAQTHPNVELIVVDNRSSDRTVEIARQWADQVVDWGPERSAQRNRGASLACGEHLLFLDSDLNLDQEVAAQAVRALDADPRLGGLVIPELAFGQGFWARCRELEKRLYLGNRHVEAARIFPRLVFEEAGGYDEAITGHEDWDLPDRAEAAGYLIGRVEAFARHDEGRVRLGETFRKKRYYGRSARSYLRKAGSTGVRRLTRTALLARPGMLVRRPHHAVGLMVLKAAEAAGFAAGILGRPQT